MIVFESWWPIQLPDHLGQAPVDSFTSLIAVLVEKFRNKISL